MKMPTIRRLLTNLVRSRPGQPSIGIRGPSFVCLSAVVVLLLPIRFDPLNQLFPTLVSGSSERQSASTTPGQSVTLLPDGHLLLLGGKGSQGPVSSAGIWDPHTNRITAINFKLQFPRVWHTATLLPDGSILVLGGIGPEGQIVSIAELLHPETGQSEALPTSVLTPRAYHAATLLTDGRVLVSGGVASTSENSMGPMQVMELWDPATKTAQSLPVQLTSARSQHSATLLANGHVLFSGGVDASGNALSYGELL